MMKNRFLLPAVALLACGMCAAPAFADIYLYDWAVNIDGTTYEKSLGDSLPGAVSLDASGLGTIAITVSGSSPLFVGLFVDYEIDESVNTFFNEYGTVNGAAAAGQTWEIDEPGYVFGDIYFTGILDGTLDNTNAVPAGSEDDVSMAMGWDFTPDAAGSIVTFTLSKVAPASGFYLTHWDPDSNAGLYFSSSLQPVPLPGAALLGSLGLGFGGSLVRRFNRRKTRK